MKNLVDIAKIKIINITGLKSVKEIELLQKTKKK